MVTADSLWLVAAKLCHKRQYIASVNLPPEMDEEEQINRIRLYQTLDTYLFPLNNILSDKPAHTILEHKSGKATFTIQNGVLKGKADTQDKFLPVIPSRLLLQEIVMSHWNCHHRGQEYCYEDILSRYFHCTGITSAQDARGLSTLIS